MNAVRARGLERCYAPGNCFLHGGRARNPAADFIGQLLQVGLERGGLLGFGDYTLG